MRKRPNNSRGSNFVELREAQRLQWRVLVETDAHDELVANVRLELVLLERNVRRQTTKLRMSRISNQKRRVLDAVKMIGAHHQLHVDRRLHAEAEARAARHLVSGYVDDRRRDLVAVCVVSALARENLHMRMIGVVVEASRVYEHLKPVERSLAPLLRARALTFG